MLSLGADTALLRNTRPRLRTCVQIPAHWYQRPPAPQDPMCTPCATRRSLQTLPFLKLLPCPPARRHCCLDVHVRRKAPTKPRQTRLPCACPSHTTAQHLEIMPWHVEFLYTLSVRCGDGAPSMCPGERTCVQRPSYLLTFITVQRASTTLLTDTGMPYTPSRPHAALPRRRCCCCLVRPLYVCLRV